MAASIGAVFPTASSAVPPSARSPWLAPIATSSTRALARPRSASTSPMETASINQPMPGAPGRMSGCERRSTSDGSAFIRRIPTSSMLPHSAMCSVRTRSAASSARAMAARTWEKILYRSDGAGAVDLSMDPNNPRILFATFWEARRSFWNLSSGGPGSGLFRSTDGGDTWEDDLARTGTSLRPAGQAWCRGLACQGWPRLDTCRGVGRQDRPLSFGRLRRPLDHGLVQPGPDAPALVLYARFRRYARSPTPSTSPTCRCGNRPTAGSASPKS